VSVKNSGTLNNSGTVAGFAKTMERRPIPGSISGSVSNFTGGVLSNTNKITHYGDMSTAYAEHSGTISCLNSVPIPDRR